MKPPSDRAARERQAYCYLCLEPVVVEQQGYDERGNPVFVKVHPTTGQPHDCRPMP